MVPYLRQRQNEKNFFKCFKTTQCLNKEVSIRQKQRELRFTKMSHICHTSFCFFNWAIPCIFFILFCYCQAILHNNKLVDFSGIRTRIVGVEGKHADRLTTTTIHNFFFRLGRPIFFQEHEKLAAFWAILKKITFN